VARSRRASTREIQLPLNKLIHCERPPRARYHHKLEPSQAFFPPSSDVISLIFERWSQPYRCITSIAGGSLEIDPIGKLSEPHYSRSVPSIRSTSLATNVRIAREYSRFIVMQIFSHEQYRYNGEWSFNRSVLFSSIIGFVHSQTYTRRVEEILSESGCVLPLSLSPPLFLILPGVASVSGAVIYHPPLGVAAGVEAKNLTEQKLSSVLGKASWTFRPPLSFLFPFPFLLLFSSYSLHLRSACRYSTYVSSHFSTNTINSGSSYGNFINLI